MMGMSHMTPRVYLPSANFIQSGSGVDFWINGKYICSSIPTYRKAESRGPTETEHLTISEASPCQVGQTVKKGDRIKFVANFDLDKYPQ